MKQIIINIEACVDCLHCDIYVCVCKIIREPDREYFLRHIENINTIPDWCPLEDAKED
jgi:hypothetical protein